MSSSRLKVLRLSFVSIHEGNAWDYSHTWEHDFRLVCCIICKLDLVMRANLQLYGTAASMVVSHLPLSNIRQASNCQYNTLQRLVPWP